MKKFHLLVFVCLAIDARSSAQVDEGELIRTKSFPVSKGGTLEVSLNGGDIHIIPWGKNEIFVKARGTDEDDFDRLTMEAGKNSVVVQNFSSCGWSGDVRFDINVPSEFDVDLRTSNGSIHLQGPLTGKIKGSTSAGDIQLGNLGGTVDVKTSGGDIRSGDIQGDLMLKTSGGDIRVGTVSGEADVNTSGGNIRVLDVKKTLWARTSGGDVDIGNVGGEATISTSGGNISVGKVSGSARISTAGGDIDLRGASGNINAKTAGGNIRLLNVTGSIDAKTAGGDVQVELIPIGKGKSKLTTAAGEIRLFVPEDAKATITARIRVQERWRSARDEYGIRSDFASDSYEKDSDDHEIRGTYTLNGGGETISLETVNADIEIRKLRGHSR